MFSFAIFCKQVVKPPGLTRLRVSPFRGIYCLLHCIMKHSTCSCTCFLVLTMCSGFQCQSIFWKLRKFGIQMRQSVGIIYLHRKSPVTLRFPIGLSKWPTMVTFSCQKDLPSLTPPAWPNSSASLQPFALWGHNPQVVPWMTFCSQGPWQIVITCCLYYKTAGGQLCWYRTNCLGMISNYRTARTILTKSFTKKRWSFWV